MPISSVVISCLPENTTAVASRIMALQLEIYHRLENGCLIAVLETDTVAEEVSLVETIIQTDGVLDVRLAYHNFEDLQELRN